LKTSNTIIYRKAPGEVILLALFLQEMRLFQKKSVFLQANREQQVSKSNIHIHL
jgi:hypothetical protein